jgi:hypothetical protein
MNRSTLAALVAAAAGAAVGRWHGRRPLLSVIDEADAELSAVHEELSEWTRTDRNSQRVAHEAWESADEFTRHLIDANAGMGEALVDIATALGFPMGRGGPPPWTAAQVAQVARFYEPDSIADEEIINDILAHDMDVTAALARYIETLAAIATLLGMPADSTPDEVTQFVDRVVIDPGILHGRFGND